MPEGWNRRMQRGLGERLRRFRVIGAAGALGGWHEAMVLVDGDPRRMVPIAAAFRQRAVVILRLGQRTELRLV